MNEMKDSPTCERASDLIAFVYNEANESETRDFELHLQECSNCREEVASFGLVRESITAWKHEALSGFVATPLATKKSALAALRQFFDLSPLWLKGATAFAVVTLCVLAALAIVRVRTPQPTLTIANPGAVYTEQDVNRIVKEALAKQEKTKQSVEAPVIVVKSPQPKRNSERVAEPSHLAKSRRPLSRAEREQLAADLRLLSTHDEASLNLLGDRINQ
jgi:anti-sigma factor RsiW